MTKILCGIVVHNTPLRTLEVTLRSLGNSLQLVKIVIHCNSDDVAYNDSLRTLASKYGATIDAMRPNLGFGAGHNAICSGHGAEADWYVCCNPDIEVYSETIERLVTFCGSKDDAILVAPRVLDTQARTVPLCRRHVTLARLVGRQIWRVAPWLYLPQEVKYDYSKPGIVEFVSGCFFLVSMANFRRLGGFSEDYFLYFEDADLSRRASALGNNYYVADATVVHLWAKAWTHSKRMAQIHITSMLTYFRKFGY
ncbi:MAG: glycosyltransferase family 2 protein [Silvanigrellales bacterium]|jgi:GT2 family glycosyltransferase|nr:glycosyltransferase family 2 protein [Silvanigrellales bacterium]